MDLDSIQFYVSLSAGLHLMGMALEVAGFFLCLAYRHLSKWTVLVAAGFAGTFASGAVSRLIGFRWLVPMLGQDLTGPILAFAAMIFLLSMAALVGGLGLTFREFRHRLAVALEPNDGRR